MSRKYCCATTVCVVMLFSVLGSARAEDRAGSNGRWRTELTTVVGVHSGKVDRDGDYYITGSVEYEWSTFERATFGLRLLPLFLYEGPETIHGIGLGITSRLYQNRGQRDGWFGELGAGIVYHSPQFEANTADMNFLTRIGLGYKFQECPWHAAVSLQHMSNAGFASRNAGVNGVGLSVGYTF